MPFRTGRVKRGVFVAIDAGARSAYATRRARVVELVDAADSKSAAERLVGSSPTSGTSTPEINSLLVRPVQIGCTCFHGPRTNGGEQAHPRAARAAIRQSSAICHRLRAARHAAQSSGVSRSMSARSSANGNRCRRAPAAVRMDFAPPSPCNRARSGRQSAGNRTG